MTRGVLLDLPAWLIIGLTVLVAGVAVGFLYRALANLDRPGSSGFAVVSGAIAVYAGGTIVNLTSQSLTVSVLTNRLIIVAGLFVGLGWLLMSLEISQDLPVGTNVPLVAGVLGAPAIFLLADPAHILIGPEPELIGTFLEFDAGPAYSLIVLVSVGSIVGGTALLAIEAVSSVGIRRMQMGLLSVAIVPALVGGTLTAYLVSAGAGAHYDYTIFGYGISAVVLGVALYGANFLDVAPIARRYVVEHMHDALVVLDGEERVVDVNPRARELFRGKDDMAINGDGGNSDMATSDDIEGMPAREFFSPAVYDQIPCNTDTQRPMAPPNLPSEGQTATTVDDPSTVVKVPIGEDCRHFSVTTRTVEDDFRCGHVLLFRDVTPLVEQAAVLEERMDHLQVLNQVVRHDIRNLLQQILHRTNDIEGDPETTGQIRQAIDEAIDVTEEAREVTQVMMTQETDPEPVPLHMQLREVIETAQEEFEDATITVEESIPEVQVRADSMADSIFRNLVTNAIVHNDRDTPEVTVEADTEDDVVHVAITDNGPGIPPSERDRIFEEGYRGQGSSGTGLGLYLVKTLIDRYSGNIQVEEASPRGTRFTVTLPRANQDSPTCA